MDERKKIVRDAYDKIAGRYLEWSRGSAVRARYLDKFLRLLPDDAKVLELGCGAGLPATKTIAEQAAHVTAVDISAKQISLARKHAPAATFFCADMISLEFPATCFDAVCAFYAITHLPREEHGEMFARIARWLKPGGIFLASFGASGTDGRSEDWLGAPNYFSHPAPEESLRLLAAAGLSVEEWEIAQQDLPGEEGLPFIWAVARKSSR
ncbi:MAG TPA: methyltransferase domain-containing protein [Rhizomicrobium sp.]|jgi:cyclopropane fatty-acyl-phospholipid synthase-like methyltransferase